MDESEALARLDTARVARMATVGSGGVPHVIPCVYALGNRTIYWAADRKPKRSNRLKRLQNIAANPNVEVVVDHYEEGWDVLWWVRARGTARVVEAGPERQHALELLSGKYDQYVRDPPDGPVLAIDLTHVRGWAARESPRAAEGSG